MTGPAHAALRSADRVAAHARAPLSVSSAASTKPCHAGNDRTTKYFPALLAKPDDKPPDGLDSIEVTYVKGFREFLTRGNLVEPAVAVVLGLAFTAVVRAVVADLITPLIAAIGGKQGSDRARLPRVPELNPDGGDALRVPHGGSGADRPSVTSGDTSLGSGRGLAVPSPDASSLAPVPDRKLGRRWEPHNCLVTTRLGRRARQAPRASSAAPRPIPGMRLRAARATSSGSRVVRSTDP